MTTASNERTMDDIRLDLAPLVAESAVFDGWTDAAVNSAAELAGIDPAAARFAFGGKPMDMIAAWIGSIDRAMNAELPAVRLADLSIRERIRTLVQFRLDALTGKEEALRRALVEMARPRNLAKTMQLSWDSADHMWRLAGDVATDYNHYTKRATLAALYASTLAVFAEDQSENHQESRDFLGRRIDGVMKFEKAKARLQRPHDESFSVTRLLGRLRYPAR
jgi:ubiquinone biosynthesis protein COQ9